MSLITPDFGLIFWMTLIFAVLFFILAKVGFPIITKMVDSRSERIEGSIRLAEEAEKRMASLKEEQEKMIQDTKLEQSRILKEAAETRDRIVAEAKDKAQDEAAKMIEHARTEIAAERESAIRDIRRQVAMISVEVAEKIVRKDLDDSAEALALIDRMVDEVSSSQKAS